MKRVRRGLAVAGIGVFLCAAAYTCWFFHRPPATELDRDLFPGVHYHREVRGIPRPLVIHRVDVDLRSAGLAFVVTPGNPIDGHAVRAAKTTAFLRENGCQIAINGSYFISASNKRLGDYGREGDPMDVVGLAASRGVVYSQPKFGFETLYLSADSIPSFDAPVGPLYDAISGSERVLRGGRVTTTNRSEQSAMTAVGLDAPRTRMLLVVVDGKQPSYSEGVTPYEMALILRDWGAADAIYFDGGGSSTLAVENERGDPELLNLPTNIGIVGLERPVGNSLGIRVGRK